MQQPLSLKSKAGSVWCYILCKMLFLCHTPNSSEPVWGTGERGRQVCGGDGPDADAHPAGLREKMKNAEGRRGTRGGWIKRGTDEKGKCVWGREQSLLTGPWGHIMDGWKGDGGTERVGNERWAERLRLINKLSLFDDKLGWGQRDRWMDS